MYSTPVSSRKQTTFFNNSCFLPVSYAQESQGRFYGLDKVERIEAKVSEHEEITYRRIK